MKTNLEVLSEATRSLRNRTLIKMGLPQSFHIFRDEDYPEYEQQLYDEIKRCNFHLTTLINVNKDIETIFSLVTLLQTITLVFMLASNMYMASLLSFSEPEMYSLIENCLAAIVQLSMACYFGSSITVASLLYRQSLYECDWYTGSKRFKTCILIMMLRLKKPLYLTAGKFFPLTLGTVISVTIITPHRIYTININIQQKVSDTIRATN
nr:unnamed protein product [Callosobruchus analis]